MNQSPPHLTLHELQELTKLPDDVLFRVLRDESVRCSVTTEGQILIDPVSLSPELLTKHLISKSTTLVDSHDALIRERLRHTIREELDRTIRSTVEVLRNHRGSLVPSTKDPHSGESHSAPNLAKRSES
jgi:hypothetical protein